MQPRRGPRAPSPAQTFRSPQAALGSQGGSIITEAAGPLKLEWRAMRSVWIRALMTAVTGTGTYAPRSAVHTVGRSDGWC